MGLRSILAALAVGVASFASAFAHAAEPAGIRLVVLPFANSGNADAEYFAEAMSEEIGASLTGWPLIHVVARVSAFKFAGQGIDAAEAGRQLGGTYVITGSAGKTGNRFRFAARLIRVSDRKELTHWDDDRPFADIFDAEDDIANGTWFALTGICPTRDPAAKPGKDVGTGAPLAVSCLQSREFVRNRTANMDAYDKFLRAQPQIRARGRKAFADAAALLEQSVAADPNYEPALALLAFDYDIAPLYDPALRSADTANARKFVQATVPKAEMLAKRAAEIDPGDANAYLALAYANMDQSNQLGAEDNFKEALRRDPDNANALHGYSQQLAAIGRIKESLAMRLELQALEPFFINYTADTAEIYWLDDQSDLAIKMLDQFRPGRTSEIAQFTAAGGRYREAASLLREMPASNYQPGLLEAAAHLLEDAAANTTSPAQLPKLGNLGWIYLHLGAPERVMEYYESNVKAGYFQPISTTWFWHPSYAAVRKLPRFKAYMREIGMVDYWRARGWPAACHPVGADDLACE